MVFPWKKIRRGAASWRAAKKGRRMVAPEEINDDHTELVVPTHFRCPITLDLMRDPVTLPTGITYDRDSIDTWLDAGNRVCPVTNQALPNTVEPIPNHALRKMIQEWCDQHRSRGMERIPTPRIPVGSDRVSEILSGISTATQLQDSPGCSDLAAKIRTLAKDSERNKRCIVANGAGRVLSAAFDAFAAASLSPNADTGREPLLVLEEIMSALTGLLPLGDDFDAVAPHLGSGSSLQCMTRFMLKSDRGRLGSRRNAVVLLREVVKSNPRAAGDLAATEGSVEALFRMIKEPICPTSTKASLALIFHMVSSPSSSSPDASKLMIANKLAGMGMVDTLLGLLVEQPSDRGLCERALGVLNGLCSGDVGLSEARGHALAVPVAVKKMLRVSEAATGLAVSVLWNMSKGSDDNIEGREAVLDEALQAGAFQKLLLVLQVGCGERTKAKATELLKMLNVHKERYACFDSVEYYRYIKRPSS